MVSWDQTWFYKRVDLFIHKYFIIPLCCIRSSYHCSWMAECLFWSPRWQSEGRLCPHSLSVQPDQEWTWSQWRPYHQHRWGDRVTSHWLTACHSILQYITVPGSTLQNTVYFTLHVTHDHYHPYLALFPDSSQGFFSRITQYESLATACYRFTLAARL